MKGSDHCNEPWAQHGRGGSLGINDGDIVKVFNELGVLGGAYVTERLRTRVAYMDHGAGTPSSPARWTGGHQRSHRTTSRLQKQPAWW